MYDTSGYKISINGVVRYGDIVFTKSEVDEKLEYYRRHMKFQDDFIDENVRKKDHEQDIEKENIEKDVDDILDDMSAPKRGRGRPPKHGSLKYDLESLENEKELSDSFDEFKMVIPLPKRGRGRPPGSKNKVRG